MENPELITKRLLLRKFRTDDIPDIQKMAGNFKVAEMTLNIPHPYTYEMAEIWISEHQRKMSTGTQVTYAITNISDGQLVGSISLIEIQNKEANLGYWIGEQYWGNGYCSEAAVRLMAYAFGELELQRICARHLAINPASGKVMINAGMEHIKSTLVRDKHGKLVDMELYEAKRT